MTFIKTLQEHLAVFAGISGSLTLLFPKVRKFLWAFGKALWFMAKAPFFISDQLEHIGDRLKRIEEENEYNGGSRVKDMLSLLVNARRHDLRTAPRPILELDGNGLVTFANEAACRLFRVYNPDDLARRSWLRWLDSEEVGDFIQSFREAAGTSSLFRFSIRIVANGIDRGLWEFRAFPIDSGKGTARVYSSEFVAKDETAKAITLRNGWAGCPGPCPVSGIE